MSFNHSLEQRADLRKKIESTFDLKDLKVLCFDLGVDYDYLGGESKTDKVVSLVSYFVRRGQIERLLQYCKAERPDLPWPEPREGVV